jgi:hypothetical protein
MIVEAFEVARRDQAAQILVPLAIHHKEHEMIGVWASVGGGRPFLSTAGCDIHFAAQDRFDVCLRGLLEELNSAENIAMVCDGNGTHFEVAGLA